MKYLKKKSWRIVAMFAATALFLVWIGNPVVRNQLEPFESSASVSDVLHNYQVQLDAPLAMRLAVRINIRPIMVKPLSKRRRQPTN